MVALPLIAVSTTRTRAGSLHDRSKPPPNRRRCRLDRMLEAQRGDEIAMIVLDRIGTADAFQRLLGVLVAERGGALVIGFRGVLVLRPTASFLCERSHSLHRPGMILRV